MPDEPVVAYPVRDVLARLDQDIRSLRADMQAIQLSLAASGATKVSEAADAAKQQATRALWMAASSPIVAAGLAWLIARR